MADIIQHHPHIEIDCDASVALDDDPYVESATISLHKSILDSHYGMHNQSFKPTGLWNLNDGAKAEQLDLFHHLCTMTIGGKLSLAPITQNPRRVLDVGAGTGLWAVEFADMFPDAEVIGIELGPSQGTAVPPNVCFEVHDCTTNWPYADNSFDYIHMRSSYGSISDWPAFYAEAMRCLKPGGWIEQLEIGVHLKSEDGTVTPDCILAKWGPLAADTAEAFGKSLTVVDESKEGITNAGFDDVVEHRYKWPIGGWSKDPTLKEIGEYNRLYWEKAIAGWATFPLLTYMNWTREEVETLLWEMRQALKDRSLHAYQDVSIVYGHKPY